MELFHHFFLKPTQKRHVHATINDVMHPHRMEFAEYFLADTEQILNRLLSSF